MKKRLCIAMSVIMVVLLAGCSAVPHEKTTNTAYLRLTDDANREVVLTKKPERIVVLNPTFLDLLYSVGGKAVGRPNSKTALRFPEAGKAAEVGFVYNINAEKVVALQPDLVIAFQGMHEKLVPILESSNIPVLVLKMKTYEDVLAKIKLFGDIAGTSERADQIAAALQDKIKAITAKLPAQRKKIVILHATPRDVTVELKNSVAGAVAGMLKLDNLAAGIQPTSPGVTTAPFSLEKIVEGDPDVILIVTMGDMDTIKKRVKEEFTSNPAWSSLRAVKNGQVVFLPSELFLLNPGIRFNEAVEYMAKTVYPEVYGHVQ